MSISQTENISGLKAENFVKEVDGKKTALYILKNKAGNEVGITNYGGALVSIMVPDKNGNMANVVQGHDNIDDVIASPEPFLSTLIGRYGNRICKGKFTLDGKEYELSKHGFAKRSEFTLVHTDGVSAVFSLRENEETLRSYPFKFELLVSFKLLENSLSVEFKVNNLSDKTMYFSCGAHEGFSLPDGIDGARVIFEKAEDHKNYKVTEGLLDTVYESLGDGGDTLTLHKELFSVDAVVLPEIVSRSLTLVSADGSRKIKVEFPDFEHLLIWQVCGADYVCVEPWSGLPDIYGGKSFAIEEKESITALSAGNSLSFRHKISIL